MKQSFIKLTSQVFQEFQVLNLTSDNESLQQTPEFLALFTKTRSRSVNTVPEELWEENNVTNYQLTRCFQQIRVLSQQFRNRKLHKDSIKYH